MYYWCAFFLSNSFPSQSFSESYRRKSSRVTIEETNPPSVAQLSTLQYWDEREDLALMYEVEKRELGGRHYPRPIYRTHLIHVFDPYYTFPLK